MTGDKVAVIDLGSNTFHLLICEITAHSQWIEIHKEREYVKLASGGIGHIDEDGTQRAIDAMVRFGQLIRKYDVKRVRAIGTAALRDAKNGFQIAEKLTSITGITIEIIDGQQEAGYILLGIRCVLPPLDAPGLIMDIGGGSVEFILYKEDTVLFAESFRIGVAVLYDRFHHSDPMSRDEINSLEQFLDQQLAKLIGFIRGIGEYHLVGASGSFEVIQSVLPKLEQHRHWSELELGGLESYLDTVIPAMHEERRKMPEIPVERLDYIVVAYLLIRFIIQKLPPERLYYCDYALKEGILSEMTR